MQEYASYKSGSQIGARYFELAYPNQPFGRPIIGTEENIRKFTTQDFKDYIKQKYHAGNMVLGIAGNVKHEKAEELAKKYFSKMKQNEKIPLEPASYVGGELKIENKSLGQSEYILGYESFNFTDKKQYALSVLSYILGGGMSSNLFKELRQKRGLVYSISSQIEDFSDTGIFYIYTATSKEAMAEVIKIIQLELTKLETALFSKSDLVKITNQLRVNLSLSLESTSGRSSKLAYNILDYGRYIPNEEIIKNFEEVTPEKIKEVAKEVLSSKKTILMYGDI